MGTLPIYDKCGKTSRMWEDFRLMYVWGLRMYGKIAHMREDSPHMGSFPMYSKTSYVGILPIHGKASRLNYQGGRQGSYNHIGGISAL